MKTFARKLGSTRIVLAALLLAAGLSVNLVMTRSAEAVISNGNFVDMGVTAAGQTAAVTDVAAAAGTVNSADFTMGMFRRIGCVYTMTAHTGTPSTTFAIQFKDPITGVYWSQITSVAVTADNTPTPVFVGMGMEAVANVSSGVAVTPTWRVTRIVAGTSPVVTGKLSCWQSN